MAVHRSVKEQSRALQRDAPAPSACGPDEAAPHRPAPDADWHPSLGAIPGPDGVSFRVWAPAADMLQLVVNGEAYRLPADADGVYSRSLPGVRAGARYQYRFTDGRLLPDPASRCQPEGVHGPSEVVDPWAF